MRIEGNVIRKQISQIMWYMRGSISLDQAWMLSESDRKIFYKLIEENIERTKKSKMPLL